MDDSPRRSPRRVFAVDWSGAKVGAGKRIWLAEVSDGRLGRLENGRSREGVLEFLLHEARGDPRFVVGFDFAFSLPAWFLEERGLPDAPRLWDVAADEAEDWLASCEPPFWGRPNKKRPDLGAGREHFRRTDSEAPSVGGARPKSVFQIGGAGAVGTGSLRGMPHLRSLRGAGFSVWPFDLPGWPRVVEIYPRLLTGAVNKSSAADRAGRLRVYRDLMDEETFLLAAASEDAFDAAVSALVMSGCLEELASLPERGDRRARLEGEIWRPSRRDEPLGRAAVREESV